MPVTTKTSLGAEKIMRLIDHTLLTAFAEEKQIDALTRDAARFGAYSVCVLPEYAERSRTIIEANKYDLRIAVVADFPLGGKTTAQRREEVRSMAGIADEVDVVVQIGMVKSGRFGDVGRDLVGLAKEAHDGGMKLKVIIETAYLTKREKERGSELVFGSGADFIKTSTGFAERDYAASVGNDSTGATTEDIALMARVAKRLGKEEVGIKASGRVKIVAQILELLAASERAPDPDHFRIGTSATEAIYNELHSE